MNEVYVVIDREYKERILGIFSNGAAAKEHAYDHNGVVFQRYVHDQPSDKGYLK
jgi:hypothetical protein